MARKAQTPILSHVFKEKAEAELTLLNSKLHEKLRDDITRIYSDRIFPDLYLLFHSCRIKTHKGLLATRAPNFYKEILQRGTLNKQKRPFFDTITVRLIESFISEVYTKNVVKHKEDAVVAQIRIVSCTKEVESPDSDVFLTPKASPSEPLPIPKQAKQEATLDDIINRSHFYNLVHIEEDLTRELAEQDALSNSFRSILEKQEQEEESRKPTILDFTKCQEEEYKVKSLTEERAKTLKLINKQYTYTIENEMSREKEEETSLAHSSGYVTGGSPKEREDVTEVASEIPDDRSPSPVSSDQVTWDSNLPEMKVEETKGNFFIDASSLRDDFDDIPPQPIPETKDEVEKKLIRRNTFELDPDDDKLAMLREEYEKVNGKEVLPIVAVQNDDHSPDSLNCDCPFEEKKEMKTLKIEQLNTSAYSDLSNSSEPNSSISSKREETESSKNHVLVSDLSSDYSLTASPLMSRRRNEFAPILSGGCDIIPDVRPPKVRTKSMNSSWIVDMSDTNTPPPETKERQRSSNSTGFFVPLDDPFPSIDSVISNSSDTKRNSSSFYIDLKNDSDTESKKKDTPQPEKKLFSIFIDIGNGKESPKSKPSSPFVKRKPNFVDRFSKNDKKSTSTSSDSGLDSVEHPEITKAKSLFDSSLEQPVSDDSAYSTKRQSFFMFIENEESPVPRRRTLPSGLKHSTNRHSWNEKKAEPEKEHKRSSSISCDNSLIDDKKMTQSWNSQVKASTELSRIIQNGAKHEFESKSRKSIEIHSDNEVVEDLCSIKSELTEASSNLDRTFVIDDVSKDVNVNTNDLELSTPSHDIVSDFSKDDTETDPAEIKSSSIEELTPKPEVNGFVKLSDMDSQPRMWKSQEVKSSRMTRSSEGHWFETKMMENSASSRSLSRLFPHLYSRKDTDDYSNPSSLQSSINPSPLESSMEGTENSCTSGTSCSRLGEDLLRMFTDEIAPDVTIDVSGRRIKAHKCILSSRCQYFAGMLSGGWVESAGNVISLQGFSYNAVHFALCHIYSGASNIPDTINIVELATLADMLCLEGLKEVIMYTLKVKYCHFFHKPCNSGSCVNGVLECLPLAAAYGLDEIYRKSLKWITKYFVRVWPTKGFANLPKELQDKCYKQHIVHLGSENVLDTIMGCEKLEANLTNVKWAQPIINMNLRLHEAAIKFLTNHFSSVLSSEAFLKVGKDDVWTMTRLEETIVSISRTLSPDQSCQSYRKIKSLLASIKRDEEIEINWRMEFLDLLTQLETSIEDCLVRQAGRAARTSSWMQMDMSLRKKIQEMACLVFAPGPRSSSVNKSDGRSPKLNERTISRPSSERGPRSLGSTPILGRNKPQVANLKRPSTSLVKPTPKPQPKSLGPQRSASTGNATVPQPKPSGVPRPKITPKLTNVKSRYLEPKNPRKEGEVPGRRMSGGKQISSSDSSRTSSPATSRVSRPTKPKTPVLASTSRLAGNDSKRESSEGSGGNQSPSVQVKRTSTFRVPTKSSAAKAQPRNVNQINNNSQRNLVSTGRSGTFLKDSPSVSKRQTRQL